MGVAQDDRVRPIVSPPIMSEMTAIVGGVSSRKRGTNVELNV